MPLPSSEPLRFGDTIALAAVDAGGFIHTLTPTAKMESHFNIFFFFITLEPGVE